MNERRAFDTFLYAKLAASAAVTAVVGTRIASGDLVPQSFPTPFCSWSWLSSQDRNALPATIRMFTSPIVFVRGTDTGQSMAHLYDLADAIDAALIGKFGTISLPSGDYYIGPIFRTAIRTLPPETDGGVRWNQVGAIYESRVQRLG